MGLEAAQEHLVASLVDGDDIDWQSLSREAGTEAEQRWIECLRVVAGVAEVHRSHEDEATRRLPGARILPWPLAADRVGPTPPAAGVALARWGHFELVERVGAGSFGDVYRAWDTRLGREVAVKLLFAKAPDGEITGRLLHEAQAIARVRHENVVTVHSVETHDGRPGLCMEFVRGQTLDRYCHQHGLLSAREAAVLGGELCRALAAVHGANLLHCDIKARNVMRAEGGRIVLMDFGAGLVLAGPSASQLSGTPVYLAPEVLDGYPPVIGSDLYGLGVLLFYLVTGRYPVPGTSLAELREAHRRRQRTSLVDLRPELPEAFVRAVERAVHPSPAERFESAGAMRQALTLSLDQEAPALEVPPTPLPAPSRPATGPDLERRPARHWSLGVIALAMTLVVAVSGLVVVTIRWRSMTSGSPASSGSATAVESRVAVLPLRNLTGGPDWWVDAVSEDLTSALGRVGGLQATAWRSVVRYRTAGDVPLPRIAEELRVGWIIDGSVRRGAAGDSVIVGLSLYDRTGTEQWTGTFTKSPDGLLALPGETLSLLAGRMGFGGGGGAVTRRLAAAHSDKPDARAAYVEARYLMRNSNPDSYRRALGLLERAIGLDPGYALAHAALARCAMEMEIMAALSRTDAQRLSTSALETALALDHDLAEAHVTLADARFYWAWDWDGAGTAYRRALELNPSLADARVRYAYYLAAMGRVDEGLTEVRRAQDIDPWSPHGGDVGMMLFYARRYDEAVAQLEQRIDQEPDQALRRFTLARAYSAAGRVEDALREIRRAMDLSGGPGQDKPFELEFARIAAQSGQPADARRVVDRLRADPMLDASPLLQAYLGFVFAALGEPGSAVDWLERAAEGRSGQLLWVDVDPRFEPLRGDARFERLVDRVRSGSRPPR